MTSVAPMHPEPVTLTHLEIQPHTDLAQVYIFHMPLYSVSAVCVAGGEGRGWGGGVCVCMWYMYVWGWLSKTWLLLTVHHRQEEQCLFSPPKSSYKVKKNPLSPNSMSSVCLLFLPRVKKLSTLKRAVCIFKKKKKKPLNNFF